jgi:hypothetical protein
MIQLLLFLYRHPPVLQLCAVSCCSFNYWFAAAFLCCPAVGLIIMSRAATVLPQQLCMLLLLHQLLLYQLLVCCCLENHQPCGWPHHHVACSDCACLEQQLVSQR